IDLAIATLAERFQEKNITVRVELDGLPLIYGDVFRLRQVVNNLLENTIRYTEEPGRLEITWAKQEQGIELMFADSAPSVPAESLPRLFERLYRVDPSRNRATGASGLGLSICHSIIKAHGGEMNAEKSVLGGLAIRFSLPNQSLST
ncbi:MAG: hypothetical protein KTR16_04380, partial [Acidiferrobacterales bacterium]|nr:hypothetical protein [Acidiferrobacterales bacterium]